MQSLKNLKWSRKDRVDIVEYLDGTKLEYVIENGFVVDDISDLRDRFLDERMINLLNTLHDNLGTTTLHLCIVGPGFGKHNYYGLKEPTPVIVDIEHEEYLTHEAVQTFGLMYNIRTVPIIVSKFPYAPCLLDHFPRGNSLMAPETSIQNLFKERIGVVLKPSLDFSKDRKTGFVLNPRLT